MLSVPCLPPLYVASRRRTTGWPAAREVGPQPSQQMQTVPRKCAIPPGNAVASHYARNWYRPMRQHSGIGVLDKAMGVLHAVAEEPCSLTELCARTGLPRATAHRLAVGLEVHRLLTRDSDGQWCPGPDSPNSLPPLMIHSLLRPDSSSPAFAKSPAKASSCTAAKAHNASASRRWNHRRPA